MDFNSFLITFPSPKTRSQFVGGIKQYMLGQSVNLLERPTTWWQLCRDKILLHWSEMNAILIQQAKLFAINIESSRQLMLNVALAMRTTSTTAPFRPAWTWMNDNWELFVDIWAYILRTGMGIVWEVWPETFFDEVPFGCLYLFEGSQFDYIHQKYVSHDGEFQS